MKSEATHGAQMRSRSQQQSSNQESHNGLNLNLKPSEPLLSVSLNRGLRPKQNTTK